MLETPHDVLHEEQEYILNNSYNGKIFMKGT